MSENAYRLKALIGIFSLKPSLNVMLAFTAGVLLGLLVDAFGEIITTLSPVSESKFNVDWDNDEPSTNVGFTSPVPEVTGPDAVHASTPKMSWNPGVPEILSMSNISNVSKRTGSENAKCHLW